MGIAAARAFEASPGTADSTAEAFQAEAEPDTAGVEAAIADSLVVAASASGGIAADSHVELAGTHLAAVEEHTEGIGRSHRPAVASCIACPWLRIRSGRDHRELTYKQGITGESGRKRGVSE
jgi:hypothetical protein